MPKIVGIYPNIEIARKRKTGTYPPTQGGCWFCWHKDNDLIYDGEFDTFVHVDCIKSVLKTDPDHSEASIMRYLIKSPKPGG